MGMSLSGEGHLGQKNGNEGVGTVDVTEQRGLAADREDLNLKRKRHLLAEELLRPTGPALPGLTSILKLPLEAI